MDPDPAIDGNPTWPAIIVPGRYLPLYLTSVVPEPPGFLSGELWETIAEGE